MDLAYRLVVLGGSGDAFLVLSLLEAFQRRHGRPDVRVVLRQRLASVARLFGLPCEINDDLVASAEADTVFQAQYENSFLDPRVPYYVHPCFLRTLFRVDQLTVRPDASQADMYRMLLRLPFDEPLALPLAEFRDPIRTIPRSVVMITDSTSWPNIQPGFWPLLADRLARDGWQVHVNDKAESFDQLIDRCTRAQWVIGPQCGTMSIMVTGQFACRKTLATPNIDGNRQSQYLASETFPYGYVTKFSNLDFDVEEFKVSDGDHAELVELISRGQNALHLWPHDPSPVMSVVAPLAPGDFLDRLAVLTVKRRRFTERKKAAIEREYQRFSEIRRQLRLPAEVNILFDELFQLHMTCYDALAGVVPAALRGEYLGEHVFVIQANRRRIEIKAAIDAICHAPYGEIKDYYGEEANAQHDQTRYLHAAVAQKSSDDFWSTL